MTLSKPHPSQEKRSQSPQGREASDDRFLAVMQESTDIFGMLTPEGSMQEVSPSWHTFTGQTEHDGLGRGWRDIVHPADQPQMEETVMQSVTTGRTGEMECHIRRRDGAYRLVRVRTIPVRTLGGALREVVVCGTDITKQELAGQMSEAQVQLAMKVSGVGMWDWDLITNQIMWTDQGKALLGKAPDARLDYQNFLAALHPDDRERVDWLIAHALAERTEYQTEYRTIWPDGSKHWLIDRGRGLYDAHNKPLHMIGAVIDITNVKQAEEQRQEANQQVRAILESITDGFLHIDPQWRFTYVNQRVEEYLERKRGEVFGKSIWDVFSQLRGSPFEGLIQHAMATQQAVHFETRRFWRERWFDIHVYPAQGGLSLYLQDMTERKQAEEALQQNKEELRLLTETMPQLVWAAQPNGFLDYFNQQCMTYLGSRLEQLSGDQWIEAVHPDDRSKTLSMWQTALQTGQAYEIEYRLREGRTGDYHWFLGRATPHTDEQGRILKWFGTATDIHEKKRTEEALQESEERFRALVDSNLIGITVSELEGNILEANEAFLSLVGYTQEEVAAGQVQWTAMTPPEYQERDARAVEELRTTGMFHPFEKGYVAKDGTRVPVLLGGTGFGQKGDVPLALSFIVDLTARQKAEEQRQEADRRIREIFESITNLFAHIDAQWRYTYVNRRVEEYAGLSQQALLDQCVWEINPGLLGTSFEYELREAMATRQERHFETWHPRWQRWLETHAYPARDGLSVYSQDITERKHIEEALRESEERFRALVDSNLIGITVADLEGNIYEANEAFLSLVGYTCKDLAAGRMNWITMTAPEDQEQSMRAVAELLATGRFPPFEKDYLTKDGKRVPVLIGCTLFRQEDSSPLLLAFVLDQAARKESERQKDLMLGMTSHELKTPLAALKGTFQLLQRRVKRLLVTADTISPEMRAFLPDLSERLAASARQVDVQTHLINDLLDVSRITANTLKLEPELCDLVPIVRETIEDLRMTAPERSLLLELPEHATVKVLADRNRIGQVLTNYVTNALRYSCADQPVWIGLSIQQDSVRVWVRDKGPGLTKEAQAELWQRFHQVKGVAVQSGSGKGLGLGLYICQTLIAQHQGEVGVESTPGKGSTFWFTLPVVT